MGTLRFFLIAGEPSGDRLGAALMVGLKTLHPDAEFLGIGGPLMTEQGLDSLFPMGELSIMGLIEVLPKYRHLKRRIAEAAQAVLFSAPDALITIDSPDFCLRVAGLVKSARPDLRTIHYVAPSVWAWRPKRAEKMARVIDHVLALLPFEPPLMQAAGMTCDFVGHPVVAEALATPAEIAPFAGSKPLILILPGSRKGEVTRLAPILGAVVAKIKLRHPLARVVLPTVPNVAELVTKLSRDWAVKPQIITDAVAKRGAFAAADMAIAASGTVSLELAANECPMVIAYDMNRLTLAIMRQMALIDTVTLVNIVSGTRSVPEFIGPRCTPDLIADAVFDVLNRPQRQKAAMEETMQLLGRGGTPPHLRAAQSVLAAIDSDPRRT